MFWLIMFDDMSRPIRFSFIMFRPIMLEDLSIMLYMLRLEDMLFICCLCNLLFEAISRLMMLNMLGLTMELSRREEESMNEVILVWMRSG